MPPALCPCLLIFFRLAISTHLTSKLLPASPGLTQSTPPTRCAPFPPSTTPHTTHHPTSPTPTPPPRQVVNLQSYAGGRNLWGAGPSKEQKAGARSGRKIKEPTFNDGLIEVVGLRSGYHTAAIMATGGTPVNATRLCQASGVKLELRASHSRPDGTPSHCYMQVLHAWPLWMAGQGAGDSGAQRSPVGWGYWCIP